MKYPYTGSCYVGVVGPENEIGACRDSIQRLILRPGDTGPYFVRATKGYEARQHHIDQFKKSAHDFILLLDHDQVFQPTTLEQLREHRRPFVSGYYMRRHYQPIIPVWYEYPKKKDQFPLKPMVTVPEPGKLIRLGASGWGCILVHRSVFEAVTPLLKGEKEVLEDDMDIYPYDLPTILKAIDAGDMETIRREIRPLRWLKSDNIGSDIRFPFFARMAGIDLWGDPDVKTPHMLNYPLSPDDFSTLPAEALAQYAVEIDKADKEERERLARAAKYE
jgi:hypothetical protein